MKSKLQSIAQIFLREVGNDLSHYTFVFPNHRAGLFFRKYIAQHVEKPIFSPRIISINECFAELSDLQIADPLTLLLRLYSEYQCLHPAPEALDRFIYWGKMMLADFSEIDNHLIPHVEALYASVRDWHAVETHYSYLTNNQRKALARFWNDFHASDTKYPNSELHQRFLNTWDLLFPLYTALHTNLLEEGLAYEGMLHREVLEHWEDIPTSRFRSQYVFLGFNALTASERELMIRLQELGIADFYFDYDSPYLYDPQNRASLFKEENLRLFKSRFVVPTNPYQTPEMNLISVPSTVGEVHEIHRILTSIIPDDTQDLTRTAIVLPDEHLLIPLLHAIPKNIGKINVTMGYPLRATSLYMPIAYPEQVLIPMPKQANAFVLQMRKYLLDQINNENSEGVYQLTKVLDQLDNAINTYTQISFSVADMQQLLKMLTLESTIPYVGEPLDGLQIMGVLETRALDFDNIIITGFNDDLYPGRSGGNSFIPYTLRQGFDLPTPERQDAIFAYNFYRMLSYAKRVWFITNSTADETHSGEVSRFLYQLKWQYQIPIHQETIAYSLTGCITSKKEFPTIEKDNRIDELRTISASALTTYLRCPKQFYYKYIERIAEPEQDESISASDLTIGNVLHAIMQHLYTPFINKNITLSVIEELKSQINDDHFWNNLLPLQDLKGDLLAECVVRNYVKNILDYDANIAPFLFLCAEQNVTYTLPNNLVIKGTIDRIDLYSNIARIIDYKTGKTDLEYTSMADVFGVVTNNESKNYVLRNKGKSQILQTMLYSLITAEKYPYVAPYVYTTRHLSNASAITCVHRKDSDAPLIFDQALRQEFMEELLDLIAEILNRDIPFHPTTESHSCDYCPFIALCQK